MEEDAELLFHDGATPEGKLLVSDTVCLSFSFQENEEPGFAARERRRGWVVLVVVSIC